MANARPCLEKKAIHFFKVSILGSETLMGELGSITRTKTSLVLVANRRNECIQT